MGPEAAHKKALIQRTREGDFRAACDLVARLEYTHVRQMVRLVCPLGDVTPAVFDVLADAVSAIRTIKEIDYAPKS